jgi:hypothetical protein
MFLFSVSVMAGNIKINVGGPAYKDFAADTGYIGGRLSSSKRKISGHPDAKLFQTSRWGFKAYKIPVPPGFYQVKLYFAETFFKAPLKRVFDLHINGGKAVGDLDIFDRVGRNKALVVSAVVKAGKNGIVITPTVRRDQPILSAISIQLIETFKGGFIPNPAKTHAIIDISGIKPFPLPFTPYTAKRGYGYIGGRVLNQHYCQGFRTYRINIKPDIYTISLDFKEPIKKRASERRFDLLLNGRKILKNFDIYKQGGAQRTIHRQYITNANNGFIELKAREIHGYSLLAGISIEPVKSKLPQPQPSINCKAVNREDRVFVSWKVPPDNSLIGFHVYRKTQNTPYKKINQNIVGDDLYCDKDVKSNLKYTYKIAAVNAAGKASKLSKPISVKVRRMTDSEFMDMIQHACFKYFWDEADQQTGLVKDSSHSKHSSIAATGFGLGAMIVGSERGYRDRKEIAARVLNIMRTTRKSKTIFGMHYHFIKLDGSPGKAGYEDISSTVDSALLLMGVIAAGEYFGGEIQKEAEAIVAAVDWKHYVLSKQNTISMGWDPKTNQPLDSSWNYYTDESILCTLLAIAAPNEKFRITPSYFYGWKREGKDFVYSWTGTMFSYQFAHCWLDLKSLGRDLPKKHGLKNVRSVNWFENSKRATLAAREFSIKHQNIYITFGPDSWGMTACECPTGYYVGGFTPRGNPDKLNLQGVIAPYGAGSSMIFTPEESLRALRYYYNLRDKNGERLVWKDEYYDGEYGFRDSFNLDNGYVADNYLGIDQGPMMLMIENYRTGLLWKQVMRNKYIKKALQKIGFKNIKE